MKYVSVVVRLQRHEKKMWSKIFCGRKSFEVHDVTRLQALRNYYALQHVTRRKWRAKHLFFI